MEFSNKLNTVSTLYYFNEWVYPRRVQQDSIGKNNSSIKFDWSQLNPDFFKALDNWMPKNKKN